MSGVRALGLALLLPALGCALLSKADPLVPRYFSPEAGDDATDAPAADRRAPRGLALQLGRVAGGSNLKERIVYRTGEHELGLYDDRRWTERPETFLRRALERALFEQGGVTRSVYGARVPVLTADLVAFEEVRGGKPVGRVRVSILLVDDRAVLSARTFTVERAIDPRAEGGAATAAALGAALGELAREVSDVVVDALGRPAPSPP